nr:hypothetical protein HmN_000076100 [Hymenolepis microstoma]
MRGERRKEQKEESEEVEGVSSERGQTGASMPQFSINQKLQLTGPFSLWILGSFEHCNNFTQGDLVPTEYQPM